MSAPRAIESQQTRAARRSFADPGVGPGRGNAGQSEWSDPDDLLNILVLADRCWRHPQAGGSGANLYAQVRRWAQTGYRITVIAGDYPGAERLEHVFPNLTVHRMGGRATVFPRSIWAVMRGLGRDADVVLEIVNGITFLTPLWLRRPGVVLVCHPHRELYVGEFGRIRGRLLAALLEELPLRLLYRRAAFLTISESAREDLVRIDGVRAERITVAYCGVEPGMFGPSPRDPNPRLLHLGRLKAYKRIEQVLDVLDAIPGATLDIVGEGDHREALEAEIKRRRLGGRVQMHGHVDDRTRAEMYARSWILLTASSSEGWGLTVIEAALCGTPSAALAVGGLRESIVDEQTGILARDIDELIRRVRGLIQDPDRLEQLGQAARRRALTFTWERTAADNLRVLKAHATVRHSPAGSIVHPDGVQPGGHILPSRSGPADAQRPPLADPHPPGAAATAAERHQSWRLGDPGEGIEYVLTEFVARRLMKIIERRPGVIDLKGGSALAVGKRARALDWLPVRAQILFGADAQGLIWVDASIRPRGRAHLRRRLFDGLYEHKLASWLAELDRTLTYWSALPDSGKGLAGATSTSVSSGGGR
jgi:glycosyltransferase involved in cell wall biosynthesis